MATCSCCLVGDVSILLDGVSVGEYVSAMNVDITTEILIEEEADCGSSGGAELYLYGPGKSVVQLTAYPFGIETRDYTLGAKCPVDVSVSIPYKYVYDCTKESDCIGGGTRRGKWVAIPMKFKQITATQNLPALFDFKGCQVEVYKYSLQAGPNPMIVPPTVYQYTGMAYKGLPFAFDTAKIATGIKIDVSGHTCDIPNFSTTGYLTGFSFKVALPQPPSVTYSFDILEGICPKC